VWLRFSYKRKKEMLCSTSQKSRKHPRIPNNQPSNPQRVTPEKIKLHERRKVLKRLGILLNGKKNAVGNA